MVRSFSGSLKTLARIAVAALLIAGAALRTASAQEAWPTQPIRIVVPYAPGGSTDLIARQLGDHLTREFGQQVLIENRAGASTNIGASAVVQAKPDGYTFLFGGVAQVLNPVFGPTPGFDLLTSLEPVSLVARVPFVVAANPKAPFNNPRELLAAAKAAPGKLSISSAQLDLYVALLNSKAGINVLHVPYKGGAPATTDAIAGQVDMVYALVPVLLPHIQGGKLKAIAVTSAGRVKSLPDVPTLTEAGVDYDISVWFGLFAPARTPKPIVDRMAQVVQKIMAGNDMGQSVRTAGAEPSSSRPEEMQDLVRKELAFWQQIAKTMPQLVQK